MIWGGGDLKKKRENIGFERAFENRKRANPKSENAHMKKKKKNAQKKKKKKKRAFEKPDARKKKRAFFFFFKRAFEKTTFSTRVRKTSPRKHEASTFSNARFFFFVFQTRVFFLVFSERAFFFVFQTRTRKRPENANARSKPMRKPGGPPPSKVLLMVNRTF